MFLKKALCFPKKAFKKVAFAAVPLVLAGLMFVSCDHDPNTGFINAEQPSITTQPSDTFWNVFLDDSDSIDLTVDASITDGGTPSYQWYSNTSNSYTGAEPMDGKEAATLSLDKDDYDVNGSYYFYVVVTNTITDNGDGGIKTADRNSNVATVTVVGNPDTDYTTSAIPEGLKGTWQFSTEWGKEEFVISDTEFASKFAGSVSYAGTIEGHRSNTDGDGYITIKYTENSTYTDSEGMFYVIHYKDLTATAISISSAYLGVDPDFAFGGDGSGGKATKAEAEATFTVSGGYFAFYSDCTNDGGSGITEPEVVIPAEIAGYFQSEFAYYPSFDEDDLGGFFVDDGFKIDATAKTFFYYMDSTMKTYWGGNIVRLIEQDDDNGEPALLIIEITDAEGDWYSPPPTVGKYFAAAYKNPTSFAVSSCTAQKWSSPNKNTGADTIDEAISEYTQANGYYLASNWPLYYPHAVSVADLAHLQGRWLWDDDPDAMILDIMGTVLLQWYEEEEDGIYDWYTSEDEALALGNIVDIINIDPDSGILYMVSGGYDYYGTNKYFAAAWKKTPTGIELALSDEDNAKGTLALIKTAYPDMDAFEDEDAYFFAFTKE